MLPLSSHQQLQTLIANQKLECINVIGLPRSNGTALHLALTQAKEVHGQLNEPFYYPDIKGRKWSYVPDPAKPIRTFDDGCAFIIERYNEENTQHKVKLVIHDLSQNLTEHEFVSFLHFTSHTVFVVRDPINQALSMLVRYVNDKLSAPGGDKLSTQDVVKLMANENNLEIAVKAKTESISLPLIYQLLGKNSAEELSSEDYKAAYHKVLDICLEEFTISWENIYHFFKVAQSSTNLRPFTVFDGESLFDNPEKQLMNLTRRIKSITFSSNMINHWTKGVKDQFHCVITRNWGDFAKVNAWNGPARNSTGITRHKNSTGAAMVHFDCFPPRIKNAIIKQQFAYREMLNQK